MMFSAFLTSSLTFFMLNHSFKKKMMEEDKVQKETNFKEVTLSDPHFFSHPSTSSSQPVVFTQGVGTPRGSVEMLQGVPQNS